MTCKGSTNQYNQTTFCLVSFLYRAPLPNQHKNTCDVAISQIFLIQDYSIIDLLTGARSMATNVFSILTRLLFAVSKCSIIFAP